MAAEPPRRRLCKTQPPTSTDLDWDSLYITVNKVRRSSRVAASWNKGGVGSGARAKAGSGRNRSQTHARGTTPRTMPRRPGAQADAIRSWGHPARTRRPNLQPHVPARYPARSAFHPVRAYAPGAPIGPARRWIRPGKCGVWFRRSEFVPAPKGIVGGYGQGNAAFGSAPIGRYN